MKVSLRVLVLIAFMVAGIANSSLVAAEEIDPDTRAVPGSVAEEEVLNQAEEFDALGAILPEAVRVGWVKRYAGPKVNGVDVASQIATDRAGNVYVTGWSQGTTSNYDFVTIKYSPAGTQLWVRRYNGPGNGSDKPCALAVDGAGNVYVTGESWGGAASGYDWATIKYNTNGQQSWVRRYAGRYNREGTFNNSLRESPLAMVLDPNGDICITGYTEYYNEDWYELMTRQHTMKYSKNGNILWSYQYPFGWLSEGKAITVDNLGNFFIGIFSDTHSDPYNNVVKLDNNGHFLLAQWAEQIFPYFHAITVDPNGNVYITGEQRSVDEYDSVTVKYSSNGNLLWYKYHNGGDKIVVDRAGNVYVTGKSYSGAATGYDYATVKYNTNGVRKWVRRYSGPGAGEDRPTDLKLDDLGNIYVTGALSYGTSSEDGVTIKYDPLGNIVWVQKYNGEDRLNNHNKALAVDAQRNVYVTGHSYQRTTGYDYNTIKYVQ